MLGVYVGAYEYAMLITFAELIGRVVTGRSGQRQTKQRLDCKKKKTPLNRGTAAIPLIGSLSWERYYLLYPFNWLACKRTHDKTNYDETNSTSTRAYQSSQLAFSLQPPACIHIWTHVCDKNKPILFITKKQTQQVPAHTGLARLLFHFNHPRECTHNLCDKYTSILFIAKKQTQHVHTHTCLARLLFHFNHARECVFKLLKNISDFATIRLSGFNHGEIGEDLRVLLHAFEQLSGGLDVYSCVWELICEWIV